MRYIFILFFIFFNGCALKEESLNIQTHESNISFVEPLGGEEKIQIELKDPAKPILLSNGYIKGFIKTISQNKESKLWHYEVSGEDISNGKLPSANFTHTVKEYEEGALVYIQIKNGKLLEIYKIGEEKIVRQKDRTPKQATVGEFEVLKKRTKERQKIAPPQFESISLE